MYSLGVVCLLSAAVALPTPPEQLRTNLPALPPSPELKSEEKDINSNVLHVAEPNLLLLDKPESEEAKNSLDSAEKPKTEKNEDKDKLDDDTKLMQKESKESKESKDSKESNESKELKEPWEYNKDIEDRPEEQKEKKKEKDSKSEESKERDESEGPIIVHVIKKPGQKGFISNLLPSIPNFHLPWPLSIFTSKFRKGGQQPIYIVRETDFAFDY